MTDIPIVAQLPLWPATAWPAKTPEKTSPLHTFWQFPEQLPGFVCDCPVAQRYLQLLGPLNWSAFPERDLRPIWRYPTIPWASLAAAELIRLCRLAFGAWGLPDAIQTDRASLFRDDDPTPFPSHLALWWLGLGIQHHLIPRHTPQANGSVERSHRTTNERTLQGRTFPSAAALQAQLDADWTELNQTCPSRAGGCAGQPPVVAFPDLLRARRPYCPEQEVATFDLARVHAFLATFTWVRLANAHGVLSLGSVRYGLGRAWAGQQVSIRFDPAQRVFVFVALQPHPADPPLAPLTRPAQGVRECHTTHWRPKLSRRNQVASAVTAITIPFKEGATRDGVTHSVATQGALDHSFSAGIHSDELCSQHRHKYTYAKAVLDTRRQRLTVYLAGKVLKRWRHKLSRQ